MITAQPLSVQQVMTPDPFTVKPLDSLEIVLKILEEKHISGLPVVDEAGKLVGVVSEADLLFRERPIQMPLYLTFLGGILYLEPVDRFVNELKKFLGLQVQDVMNPKLTTISAHASVGKAAELMLGKRINRLPVLDDAGQLIGIVTRTDLLKALQPESGNTMTSSIPLKSSELIDCARANAASGIQIAASQCGYAENLSEFQQELQKACTEAGFSFHELRDLIQSEDRSRGIEIAPETLNQL
jgi:CBS domain-containing protein